jgi:hypothetical protein
MFDGLNVRGDEAAYTWTPDDGRSGEHGEGRSGERSWQAIDRELRGIAKRRAALDANEARWLREAERAEIWKPLGMVNLIDYMERVLGYAPRTAQQRMQVARALETLPVLTDALAMGELSFSAVRELVRVATPGTEQAWRTHVSAMNLRQIEEAVAGRRPGDLPSDVPDDNAREHVVTLRLDAGAYAMWRQGRTQLDEEHDHRLEDSELVTALFSTPRTDGDGEISGRAKFQIALSLCPRCDRGWQEGAGARVPVDHPTVERARCDAQHLGSLDDDGPERAHQDIPPNVVRFVWRRDHGRCQTPGCRSARGLELHHIVHREDGGSHEPKNITLRCSACHIAHHRGLLDITGEAPDRIVTTRPHASRPRASSRPHERPVDAIARVRRAEPNVHDTIAARAHVGAVPAQRGAGTTSRFDEVTMRTQARDALVRAGWKHAIARIAVDESLAALEDASSLETLLREALRRCLASNAG